MSHLLGLLTLEHVGPWSNGKASDCEPEGGFDSPGLHIDPSGSLIDGRLPEGR